MDCSEKPALEDSRSHQDQLLCNGNGKTYPMLTKAEMTPDNSTQSKSNIRGPRSCEKSMSVRPKGDFCSTSFQGIHGYTFTANIAPPTPTMPRITIAQSTPPHQDQDFGYGVGETSTARSSEDSDAGVVIGCEEVTLSLETPSRDSDGSNSYTRPADASEEGDRIPECALEPVSGNNNYLIDADVSHQIHSPGHDGSGTQAIRHLSFVNGSPVLSQEQREPSWETAALRPLLAIRCKDLNALLYKDRFGSGNRGKCILFEDEWLTPIAFGTAAGSTNSKNWTTSIRSGKKSLRTLIKKGYLVPHSVSCVCPSCTGGANATGPLTRPSREVRDRFTCPPPPRQRKLGAKQKAQLTILNEGSAPKLRRTTANTSPTQPPQSSVGTLPASDEDAWIFLENRLDQIISASISLKGLVQEMRERTQGQGQQKGAQKRQRHNSTLAKVPMPSSNNMHQGRRKTMGLVGSAGGIQASATEEISTSATEPCQSCHLPGSLTCASCNKVKYCSTICWHTDWAHHSTVCHK